MSRSGLDANPIKSSAATFMAFTLIGWGAYAFFGVYCMAPLFVLAPVSVGWALSYSIRGINKGHGYGACGILLGGLMAYVLPYHILGTEVSVFITVIFSVFLALFGFFNIAIGFIKIDQARG